MAIPNARPLSRPGRMAGVIIAGLFAIATVTATSVSSAAPTAPNGDVIRAWNDLALDSIRAVKGNDARAARSYAMTNVAMYDAVNGVASKKDRRRPAIVAPDDTAKGDPRLAAAQAAHDVLSFLFPDRASIFDDRLNADVDSAPANGDTQNGRAWGSKVASGVIAARANDGTNSSTLPPFAIADPSAYYGGPPPDTTSIDYAAAYNTVKLLGDRSNTDQPKTDTFWFWSLGTGTDQPPGAWVQIAELVSQSRSLSLADTARMFALETMSMSDTVGPTNTTKTTYNRVRPTFAIHDAANDGNDDTAPDTEWTARAPSPGSPGEYWSGHSAFSAAAARALAGFFCDDHATFTITTDVQDQATQANVPHTFASFSDAASDAGLSRVYGGLHFPYSNEAGLNAGNDIAEEVLANSLLLQGQPTHHGACPL